MPLRFADQIDTGPVFTVQGINRILIPLIMHFHYSTNRSEMKGRMSISWYARGQAKMRDLVGLA
jgi:hypothetical protein